MKTITTRRFMTATRRCVAPLLALSLLCSGCASGRMTGTPGGVMAGASVGGQLGGAVGGLIGENNHGWHGGYRGSAIGTIVGTVAGALIGNALTTPRDHGQGTGGQERMVVDGRAGTSSSSAATLSDGSALRLRNIRFIDDSRDRTIQSGESSKLIFEIMNEGDAPARNVVPIVSETTGMKRIYISSSILIEEIAPHEGVKYTATVMAGSKIKTGTATFHVGVANEYGEEMDWQEFSIPTER